jgi:hypothetical protein
VISTLVIKAKVEAVIPIARILFNERLRRVFTIAKMAGMEKTKPIIGEGNNQTKIVPIAMMASSIFRSPNLLIFFHLTASR